ncbi:DedA family protein, partial [Turicibacter sanguinis]|nr:DedA family protein [Turicibacter sanguinis]
MFTTEILEKLDLFGPYLIFLLIFLEGLNLTGIPAIVIMPAIGFSIYTSSYSFFFIY